MTDRDWVSRADELAGQAYAAGEPTAWFDRLYAQGAAGTIDMPWDRRDPQPLLADWFGPWSAARAPGQACVVGCGLGADAEYLAAQGWRTTGFDLSSTAIEQASRRHLGSAVSYRVADLLDLPADLLGVFDLVVEVFTLQAMPNPPRADAARGITSLLAPGGTLLAIGFRDTGVPTSPPPFPLTRDDLRLLEIEGVVTRLVEELPDAKWRAELVRR
ncbi:MAG TPA: class I SAM-dependent methyltransferase [Nakamurella sp.]